MAKRGRNHVVAQKNARIRDGGICQICGSRDHPEGHHALDVQFGGTASVDNMVTLCRGCHNKVHKGVMDIFIFQ